MPAIPPTSDGFIIDLLLCRDLGGAHSFSSFQDDVTSLDQSLGTRGALNHPLQKLVLQGADMKRFCLWKRHEGSLLHGVLPCILSYPCLPRYFREAVLGGCRPQQEMMQLKKTILALQRQVACLEDLLAHCTCGAGSSQSAL